MKLTLNRLALAVASVGILTIYGCGGGGGGGTAVSSTVLSGTAATGAAFTDATIIVKDKTGATVGTSSKPVGADGQYAITLSAGAAAPFVLIATRTSADGAVESLVSVVPAVTGTSATVNITPITNLIASRLATSGDPLQLAAEVVANPTIANATAVTSKVQEVQTILAPILTATATTSTDPLSGTFPVNGAGYDRLLDTIKVTITPTSSTATNVEIGIKLATGVETAPPPVIQFTSSQPVATITANNTATTTTINSTALIDPGTATLIADHLAQLQACYALPLASRIVANGTTAADISATECKNVFFGNNPANFKSNGRIVGKGQAFNGIFVDGGTGMVFSQGTYEFTLINGDIVVGYKSRSTAGNEVFDTFALRIDTDRKLKQIGNQYAYPGAVSAFHQARQFITLNQTPFSYYSTGYTVAVDDVTQNGVSIFDHVNVTTPSGTVLTLKPKSGVSFLPLVKSSGITTTTNAIRLNSEYADTTNTADPALKDTNLFFASPAWSNTAIAALPAQSVWKLDYYLASAPTTIAATQSYRTRARALTIPELKQKGLAQLLPAAITDIQSTASTTSGLVPVGGQGSLSPGYSVATGALPPTSITMFGVYGSTLASSFTDSVTVGSTARTGNVLCSPAGVTDLHCTTGTGGTTFAPTAAVTGINLLTNDPSGRVFSSFFATYKLQ